MFGKKLRSEEIENDSLVHSNITAEWFRMRDEFFFIIIRISSTKKKRLKGRWYQTCARIEDSFFHFSYLCIHFFAQLLILLIIYSFLRWIPTYFVVQFSKTLRIYFLVTENIVSVRLCKDSSFLPRVWSNIFNF